MTKDNNDYTWWHAALRGEFGPIHEGQPEAGCYRMKTKKAGRWTPVQFWRDEAGVWRGIQGEDTEVDPRDIWTWACRYPITYDVYVRARTEGGFIDEPPAISKPEYVGPHDEIHAIREELAQEAQALADEAHTAPKAAAWAKRLSKLRTRADNARRAEKEPFRDIGKAIDAKWEPIIDQASELLDSLKKQEAA